MFEPSIAISHDSTAYGPFVNDGAIPARGLLSPTAIKSGVLYGLRRRVRREVRRRKVGRAFDMALEVARVLPQHSRQHSHLLDVGCGNGFIAHHLSAMLGMNVIGLDLGETTQAPIEYRQFDGRHFPLADGSFDAVLLCYVLHHVQDTGAVISELRRVLRDGGLAIIYEDIPMCWWDRLVCWTHNLKWRGRTGICTFRREDQWRQVFSAAGFEIVSERRLSRWRNLAHPVSRRCFVLMPGTSVVRSRQSVYSSS